MIRFTSRDLQRQAGSVQDAALREPVAITRNGRVRLVLLSIDEYDRLKKRDRIVFRSEDLSPADIDRIAASEPPADAAEFDSEVDDARR